MAVSERKCIDVMVECLSILYVCTLYSTTTHYFSLVEHVVNMFAV